jgi:TonB family protein
MRRLLILIVLLWANTAGAQNTICTGDYPAKFDGCKYDGRMRAPWQYYSDELSRGPEALNLKDVAERINYPDEAIKDSVQGKVTIKILVGEDGRVIKLDEIRGPSVFHNVVRANVVKLLFSPAINDSRPVQCWVTVPFNFKLSKKDRASVSKPVNKLLSSREVINSIYFSENRVIFICLLIPLCAIYYIAYYYIFRPLNPKKYASLFFHTLIKKKSLTLR